MPSKPALNLPRTMAVPTVYGPKRAVLVDTVSCLVLTTDDESGADRASVLIISCQSDAIESLATALSVDEAERFVHVMQQSIADAKRLEAGASPVTGAPSKNYSIN